MIRTKVSEVARVDNRCIRVLHVFGSLDRGGAESMVMSLYRQIDRNKVQFDFIANERDSRYAYEDEIQKMGGRVYYLPGLSLMSVHKYLSKWMFLLGHHPEWSVIHIHHTSSTPLSIPVAKKLGRTTIAHSHTAGWDGTFKARLKVASRYPARYLADILFACSPTAAQWMFGNQASRAHVLNNAIDTSAFRPDTHTRERIRNELGLEPSHKVVGHVGRFAEVKNHAFMLDVLGEMVKQDPESVLVLVGDGPLKASIESRAGQLGLSKHLLCTGVRPDIADLMQGMDAFVFPSLYEGLPVTLVEAQASGLSCLVSDTVSDEVKLTECIEFMSLATPPSVWAARLLAMADQPARLATQQALLAAGYDVRGNAQWLQSFYLELMDKG